MHIADGSVTMAPTSIRVCANKTRAKVEKEKKEKQDRFAAVYRDDIGSPKWIQPHYQYVVNTCSHMLPHVGFRYVLY